MDIPFNITEEVRVMLNGTSYNAKEVYVVKDGTKVRAWPPNKEFMGIKCVRGKVVVRIGSTLVSGYCSAAYSYNGGKWVVPEHGRWHNVEMDRGDTLFIKAVKDAGTLIDDHSTRYAIGFSTIGEGDLVVYGSLMSAISVSGELLEHCCENMFINCTNIVDVSGLRFPDLNVAPSDAYNYMFKNCTRMKYGPGRIHHSVVTSSYYEMFCGCSAMETTPYMSFVAGSGALRYTFKDCTSLKIAFPLTPDVNYFDRIFEGCSSLATMYVAGVHDGFVLPWSGPLAPEGILHVQSDVEWPEGLKPEGWVIYRDFVP